MLQAVTKLKILSGHLKGCSEDVNDVVLLLVFFFHGVEETCRAKEVQVESLPVTPCINVCGRFTFIYTEGACMEILLFLLVQLYFFPTQV